METDYLIIGAGAVGMSFADTLLSESDANITIVDRRSKPGGHWNDAYSFVTLHQPSEYYGVNSTPLGEGRKDDSGPNQGLYELASGSEMNTYFDKLMQKRFLPSGRVIYYPMSEYRGDGHITSLLSGAQNPVTVRRKTIDTTFFSPTIPSTHTPKFTTEAGVRAGPPNALPQLWLQRDGHAVPQNFCVIGAGKTAMDAVLWLLSNGALADSIQWVVPRDSWLINRLNTQPGLEFFEESIGGEADKLAAFADSASIEEVFLKLEALGQMFRIDPSQTPTMFHYATVSRGEVALLRTITKVIRMGRVQSIEHGALNLQHGRVAMNRDIFYVDCTASAVEPRVNQPVFAGDRITVQLLRAPLVVQSAAVTAYIEVHGENDVLKNRMCTPVPFPQRLAGFALATQVGMMNQMQWTQDKALRHWMRNSRLDAFGKMVAEIEQTDIHRQAILARLRTNGERALLNIPRLLPSDALPA